MDILKQATGRFDRRFGVGPARWEHWDLLWLNEGRLRLYFGTAQEKLELTAPSGVLIPPGTEFHGSAIDGTASASVTHFQNGQRPGKVQIVLEVDRLHVQNLIRLSLEYARRGETTEKRQRLLDAILDCFVDPLAEAQSVVTQVDRAWREAIQRLERVRSLADVAAFAGQAESTFRAAHRGQYSASAGRHLKELRLTEAERYLGTTGLGLAEIAHKVGYGHAETLSSAFKRSRGRTPGEYRRWCQIFA